MDEATSALDNITEKYVVQAIEKLKGDMTIVTIAHRISTLANSDRIYLMNKGLIEDCGNMQELLKRNIDYYEILTSANDL